MKIRLAEEKDCEQVLKIAKEVQDYHRIFRPEIFADVQPYSNEFYQTMLKDENINLYVACDDNDKAIAYSIFTIQNYSNLVMLNIRKVVMIDDFCVLKECKKKGIGRALFKSITDFAKAKLVDAIELNIWHFNEETIEFCKAMGMTEKSHEYELIFPKEHRE